MNKWLNDELAELKQKKIDKAENDRRLDLLQQQTEVLWRNLKPILKDAVVQMNADGSEFRKLTGGLSWADEDKKIVIGKTTSLPAINLEVSCGPTSISWEYIVNKTDLKAKSGDRRGHVTKYVELKSNGQPSFNQKEEASLEVEIEQAVRQMLRPLIHAEW